MKILTMKVEENEENHITKTEVVRVKNCATLWSVCEIYHITPGSN